MIPDIDHFMRRRRQLGWGQKMLAKKARLSQSMINKIENKKINPSYEAVKRIHLALSFGEAEPTKKAKDLMIHEIAYAPATDTIKKTAKTMEKKGFSQLPVTEEKRIIGSISEQSIIHAISKDKEISKLTVKDLMNEPFPQISQETPIKLISQILEENQAILLTKGPEITGIITRSDLLKMI